MGTVTAVVSDTHIGSWLGLSLHEWNCDTGEINDKGEPIYKKITATPGQDWLYQKWQNFWMTVWKAAHPSPHVTHRIVAIHLGDVVDGRHHDTPQSMPNIVDQEDMAVEILKPIANMTSKLIILRGTEAHVGPMGGSEVRVAQELGALCVFEGILDIDGLILDVAHHGRAGRRDWSSSAAGMATQAVMDSVFNRNPQPRYVFRGHNHLVDDSGEKVMGTRAVAFPSWQLRTSFGYRVAAGKSSDIGGVIVLPNGALDMGHIRYTEAPGQRHVIKI